MTGNEIVEEVYKELEGLVVEYLNTVKESGRDRETIEKEIFAILEEKTTVKDVREALLELIALVDFIPS